MLSRRHFHDCSAFRRSRAHLLGTCSSNVPKTVHCKAGSWGHSKPASVPGKVFTIIFELTAKVVNVRKIRDPQKLLLFSWPFCAIKQFSVRTCRDNPDEFECSSVCLCGKWSLLNRIRLYFGFVSAEVWTLQSHIRRGRPFKNPFWVFKRVTRKEKGQYTSGKKAVYHLCI